MRWIERRLARVTDELARLRREEELAAGELEMHRHIDDDARTDAAVGGPAERAEAHRTRKDVARLGSAVETLRRRRARLEEKRDRLLDRLVRRSREGPR